MSKLTKAQRRVLLDLRKAATFESANFDRIAEPNPVNTEWIKERTRIYRDTWLIGRIDSLLHGTEREWLR